MFDKLAKSAWMKLQVMDFRYREVTTVCRRLIRSHFNEECYLAMDVSDQEGGEASDGILADSAQEKPTLVGVLIRVLQLPNDELRMTSARLLFDMHKRENILFSNALESYLATEASSHTHNSLINLGSLSDKSKLLVKMHMGQLEQRLKRKLKEKLQKISFALLLEEDPAEPDTSYQRITYSSREIAIVFI